MDGHVAHVERPLRDDGLDDVLLEQRDLPLLLAALKQSVSFIRQIETALFTASAWVVNPARNKVLMIYHNIYNSWSWTGGHADGETDL